MLFFQEELRKMLQKELNKNTKDVLFDVSLFFKKHDSTYTRLMKEANKLRDKVIPFSLLHIERIDVSRVNLPKHNIIDAIVQATINIPTSKNNMFDNISFNSVFGALDEFVLNTNAMTLPFGELEYDLIAGGFQVDYELSQSRSLGFNLNFKDEEDYLIFKTLRVPDDLIRINKVGKTLVFEFRNTGNTGYNTLTFDIELGKDIEIVIKKKLTDIEVLVDLEKKTTISTSSLVSNKDEVYAFNGTIKEFYAQNSELITSEYQEGSITLDGLFNNPTVKVIDFIALENLSVIVNTLTEVGKIGLIGSQGYATFSFDTVAPLSGVFEMFGTDYQEYDFTFNVLLSKETFMGNQVEYYLDDVRIYPFNKNTGVGSDNMQEQMINSPLSSGVNESTGISNEFTLYYKREKKLIELLDYLKEDKERNEVHNLKIVYPTHEFSYDVSVSEFGISPLEGEPLNYSMVLSRASDILKEE